MIDQSIKDINELKLSYEVSGSHGGEYEEDSLLGYNAV
jgi:hypothetical protein